MFLLFVANGCGAELDGATEELANDGERDDLHFGGPETQSLIRLDDQWREANDRRARCKLGKIWLRMSDK